MPDGDRVFDSWPLLALLQDEPAADRVASLIGRARDAGQSLWITTVNLGEVWYRLARNHSASKADQAITEIRYLGFQEQEADWELTRAAAQFKARYPIAYADCFAAALAKRRRAELVTGDPEFRRVAKEIRIHWVG